MSEYDPLIRRSEDATSDDLESARTLFAEASRAYLSSPIPWLVWAIVLPGAGLLTPLTASRGGASAVLALWSVAVLIGGGVEGYAILRRGGRRSTPLGGFAMKLQGNISLVGVVLSVLLVWQGLPTSLPGLWLLLIGHSFVNLGGLAFRPMRQAGFVYQLGGALALWPGTWAMPIFAAATALGNLWIALGLIRRSA